MTKEYFIRRATDMYDGRYDYDKVEFVDRYTKVTITCPIHGDFQQTPAQHLHGKGCPMCGKEMETENRKSNVEEFIKKAREIHGDKYDYSKFVYERAKNKGIIICPIHGEFMQSPDLHLRGSGCPKCKGELRKRHMMMDGDEFIELSIEKYGNRFDLSHVNFVDHKTPVEIICREHGAFMIKPHMFLRGQNCPECGKLAHGSTFQKTHEQFISEAKEVHGDKYDYSKTKYKKSSEKVCIICHEIDPLTGKEHGEFWQEASCHLQGQGCPKCSPTCKVDKYTFIKKAILVHGDKYNYDNVKYVNAHTPVEIVCPTHGSFWQMPYKHLGEKHSCPTCNNSKLENEIYNGLNELGVDFVREKQFTELGGYKYDFFIEEYKILIECHGVQHFKQIEFFFKNEERFQKRVEDDIKKYNYAINNGYKIFYVLPLPPDNTGIDYTLTIFKGIYHDDIMFKTSNDLLNYIKKIAKIL